MDPSPVVALTWLGVADALKVKSGALMLRDRLLSASYFIVLAWLLWLPSDGNFAKLSLPKAELMREF